MPAQPRRVVCTLLYFIDGIEGIWCEGNQVVVLAVVNQPSRRVDTRTLRSILAVRNRLPAVPALATDG